MDVWSYNNNDAPILQGALVYIATDNKATNVNYAGPASMDAIAAQIAQSRGPSGCNAEYLYKLASALRAIEGADDEELFVLENQVRALRGE